MWLKLEKQGIVIGMMPARQVYADAIAGQALLDLVYFCDERSGRKVAIFLWLSASYGQALAVDNKLAGG